MTPVIIDIPMPPSLNGMYFNRRKAVAGPRTKQKRLKGRGKTKTYQAWLLEAGWAILQQKVKPIPGRVKVSIELSETARGDADNRNKACLDLLVRQHIIEADSKKIVRKISAEWSPAVTGARVTITPIA